MSTPIRLGVLGAASIARRRMLPAFAASPDIDLVALASRDPERAAPLARTYGCRVAPDYRALLADDTVEAVYLPLPAGLHARWVREALLAGKHVLAEKPLTTDPRHTARLVELAHARGLALLENVMFVRHAQHEAVRALVADGQIGEPREFHATFTVPRLPAGDIRYRPDLGGGALWDTGVYPVRAALHLLGGGLRLAGATLRTGASFAVPTAGAALLVRPADGVSVQLSFGLDNVYRSSYELRGSTGRVSVAPAFTPSAGHRPVLRVQRGDERHEVVLPPDDQVANTVAVFAAAVRAGAAPPDLVLEQAELLDAIRRHATAVVHRA